MMYLRVSKFLDVPAHARMLINASVHPPVVRIYVILVWDALLYKSMFSGFDIPKPMREQKKYLTMDKIKRNPGTAPYFRGY